KHIVEIVRNAAGQLADEVHLLLLVKLGLKFALCGRLKDVDDRRLLVALLLLDRGHIEASEALAVTAERGVNRRDFSVARHRLSEGRLERGAVPLRHAR